ncbi:trypsin-like peptidase domain-containing protein [Amycolatopsis sp. PS_44_ISF1]|uniref:trypsin-like peptidase domain-containing protein n=1 Tax=Amycolatopsis sp. PS_44_ISF1 TaxID=2974917 RepID=UPI0028DF73D8|nr:trypsin-like peptidase domain-containing protein [Amycolatopsis sp. PS_44_ISF1]MDT8909422.1 trypsin-like peptidase domain-containing protein [Amycolatopsis sp. PS_44_ISF1]
MTEQPDANPAQPGSAGDDRLGPRPLDRPAVDPAQTAVFGRPHGVDGAFDQLYTPAANGRRDLSLAPPAPESLAEAFRRPPGAEGVLLERPREATGDANAAEAPLWTDGADPWRDPAAGAVLAGPAVPAEDEPKPGQRPAGALLSLPEVLFGRRVQTKALVLLGVVALLVGAVGGLVGWWVADTGSELTGSATISETDAAKERPPGSVADIAKRVSPAVVSLEVFKPGADSGEQGSGVVIDPQGYVLTNEHVVNAAVSDPSTKVTAIFNDGTRTEAKVVGSDQKSDLAVVKVNVTNPVVLQIGRSAGLQVGDAVIAVGSPLALQNTVTSGIVSALNRPITAGGDNGAPPVTYEAIQTDAAINHGNSGGALVDSTGALVGINSSIRSSSSDGGSIGIGFAIPSDYALKIAKVLIKDGKVNHADIGINASSTVAGSATMGAQVKNVAPNGPAAAAGIKEGDVITKIGDRPVRDSAELTVAVRNHDIGEVVPVQLARDGALLVVDVTLGSD